MPSKIIICTSTPNDYLEHIARSNRIELRINPERNGIANDWNFALNQVNEQYVTLAHQDDVYHPAYSQNMVDGLKKFPDSLIAYSNYQELVHKKSRVFVRKRSLNFLIKNCINLVSFMGKTSIHNKKYSLLKFGSPIGCPTVTYNKQNIPGFKFSNDFSINVDWCAWHELSLRPGSFVWINKILMSHRIHVNSETSLGLTDNRRQKEDRIMFDKFWSPLVARLFNSLYGLSYLSNR